MCLIIRLTGVKNMKNLTRKLISVLLSAVMACGTVLAASASAVKYGDADCDGTIDSKDALAVLEHSILKNVLTGDALLNADVNGDKVVNSIDALEILQYSVGIIKMFSADPSYVPQTGDEILAAYASAVSKARDSRPGYKLINDTCCTDATVKVSDPFGLLKLGGMSKSELEEETKQETMNGINDNSHYESVMPKNSTNSLNNLPSLCTLTDSSKLKSITLDVLSNGNYRIKITFNDEKNPKSSGALCKVMGVEDYESTLAEIKESAEIEDAEGLTDVELDELSYKNAWITCEINPAENEFVDYQYGFICYTASTVTALSIGIATGITIENTGRCTNFVYNF